MDLNTRHTDLTVPSTTVTLAIHPRPAEPPTIQSNRQSSMPSADVWSRSRHRHLNGTRATFESGVEATHVGRQRMTADSMDVQREMSRSTRLPAGPGRALGDLRVYASRLIARAENMVIVQQHCTPESSLAETIGHGAFQCGYSVVRAPVWRMTQSTTRITPWDPRGRGPRMNRLMTQLLLLAVMAVGLTTVSTTPARAELYWKQTRAATAHVKKVARRATAAIARASRALAATQSLLASAQAQLASVRSGPSTQIAQAALAAAKHAIAAAEARIAALSGRLRKAAVIAAAWYAGTLTAQAGSWLLHWCWDPVCDLRVVELSDEPIYAWPTDEEVNSWVPTLMELASGEPITPDELIGLGQEGLEVLGYLRLQIRYSLIAHRGAAAYSAERYEEVMAAYVDLKRAMTDLPRAQQAVAQHIVNLHLDSGLDALRADSIVYEIAIGDAIALADQALFEGGADPQEVGHLVGDLIPLWEEMAWAVETLEAEIADGALFGPLSAYFGAPLTLEEAVEFTTSCELEGPDCLPASERSWVNVIADAAGVRSEAYPDLAVAIAEWDAEGMSDWEIANFGPNGTLTAYDTLSAYIDNGESACGLWLDTDLDGSPLVTRAKRETAMATSRARRI